MARSKAGQTPLHFAMRNVKVVRMLIETAQDNHGLSPLGLASQDPEPKSASERSFCRARHQPKEQIRVSEREDRYYNYL
jgi:hypothetical protein